MTTAAPEVLAPNRSARGLRILPRVIVPIALALTFLALIILVNRILPIPDLFDFTGLGQICLLMKEKGLRYCFNGNWGFALPLLTYGVAQVSGNLLVAQRVLGAISGAVLLLALARLMTTIYPIEDWRIRSVTLAVAILSASMMDLLVSVHLDIIPVALSAGALSLLWSKHPSAYLLSGFLIASASWFRFHFAAVAILYLVLIVFYNPRKLGTTRLTYCSGGVFGAFLIPRVVGSRLLGTLPPSNTKAILAGFAQVANTEASYELSFQNLPYRQIFSEANWTRVFASNLLEFSEHPLVILLCILFLLDAFSRFRRSAPRLRASVVLPAGFWFVAVFPFLVLRGITPRLEATLLLLLLPYAAYLFATSGWGVKRGLALSLAILCVLSGPRYLANANGKTRRFRQVDELVRSTIPKEVVEKSPRSVLNGVYYYYNKNDQLWLWNPALIGDWECRETHLRRQYGIFDITDPRKSDLPHDVSYVVLLKYADSEHERKRRKQIEQLGEVKEFDPILVVKVRRG